MKGPSVKQNMKHSVFKIGRSTPWVDLPVDLNGNFRFLLFKLILEDQLADLPPR